MAPDHLRLLIRRPVLCLLALSMVVLDPSQAAAAEQAGVFPFAISGDKFARDGRETFLNVFLYQPLEPGQGVGDTIRLARIQDDLRRFRHLAGSDPVVVRVTAQPTAGDPIRMPQQFYDGLRSLGFWIIRDIFFDEDYEATDAAARGRARIDAVLGEVRLVGSLDRIFAWQLGNEFNTNPPNTPEKLDRLRAFLCDMIAHLKTELAGMGSPGSDWVTWNVYPPTDPLRTDATTEKERPPSPAGTPVLLDCPGPDLDFFSVNAYSYEPTRLRDHQGGFATGTPYAGYLAALKEHPGVSGAPLVVSETGLSDAPIPHPNHGRLTRTYPSYRKGGIDAEAAAEGLAARYWDARLGGAAGVTFFEWNDEWWKEGDPSSQGDDQTEEHFGLLGFDRMTWQAGAKVQWDVMRDLFGRKHAAEPPLFSGLAAGATALPCDGETIVQAVGPRSGLRYEWYAGRGLLAGGGQAAVFRAGGLALGPSVVTLAAVDARGRSTTSAITLQIQPCGPPALQLLTLGTGTNAVAAASGRVADVDLIRHKLTCFIETDQLYVQPFLDMKSIWVRSDGYFWTTVDNRTGIGRLRCWVVPRTFSPPDTAPSGWEPPGQIASAALAAANDLDNDLLPDPWEAAHFGSSILHDRYDDPDGDGADNLEEFLGGTLPVIPDNDADGDGLPDGWERFFFGSMDVTGGSDDPDLDGLENLAELQLGIRPDRQAVDSDRDSLPDLWERQVLGHLSLDGSDLLPGAGVSLLEAYGASLPDGAAPGEPRDVTFQTDGMTLSWTEPPDAGGAPATLVYDTLRATAPAGFSQGDCVDSDGPDRAAVDPAQPAAGGMYFYLVRAETWEGQGPLGSGPGGSPRAGRTCP
jgi:hypothetical protein